MKLIILLLILSFQFELFAQVDSIVYNRLQTHISFLASDSLHGRATGSMDETLANNYLIEAFKKGKKCKNVKIHYSIHDSISSEMVTCFVNNRAENTLLIGAHIDHIGMGGEFSKSFGKTDVHNGADDNASGVALLIELQRFIVDKKLPFNVLFVAFTGHEIGTYGSEYIANNWSKKWKTLSGVVNFDMMGRMDQTTRMVYLSSNEQPDSIFNTPNQFQLKHMDRKKVDLLDTKHFLNLGIPCFTFSTGMHNDYHRITDDSQHINYEGLYLELEYFETWLIKNETSAIFTVSNTKLD